MKNRGFRRSSLNVNCLYIDFISALRRAENRARIAFAPGLSQNSGQMHSKRPAHVYEVRPLKDKRGFDLISDALPFGGLWYTKTDHAVECAKFRSRSHAGCDSRLRCSGQRD
jgi:hypothetical protein